MRKLTNSMRNKFASCHRAFKIAYEDRLRPVKPSESLTFGTAMHKVLEMYWGNGFDMSLSDDIQKVNDVATELSVSLNDRYIGHTLLALFDGYYRRYHDQDSLNFRCVGAEIGFEAPLMNPSTGATSKTFVLAGKIDAIAEDMQGKKLIVEHKTTGSDIGPGSDYWRKLPIDGQVSGYYVGAKVAGHHVENCLYDVIRKPTIRPMKATPIEQRKYTKEGKLYASQNMFDEEPWDWYMRLCKDIELRPDYYFARMEVARSETDLEEYLYDMWAVSNEIREAKNNDRWSRNPQSCTTFGTCEYFDVCTGCASLDDITLFQKVEDENPELQ